MISADFQDCEIARRVRTHQFRGQSTVVVEIDFDVLGTIDYMMVRQDVSVGANDHARSQRVFDLAWRGSPAAGVTVAEELAKQRIFGEWKLFRSTHSSIRADGHDGG
jgi:hypothetical protein